MKVRVRYDSWLARVLRVGAITLYPFVFVAGLREETPVQLLQHEFVHVRQVRAMGWLRFYAAYVWEWFTLRLRGLSSDGAYMALSFEREAYAKQNTTPLTADEAREIA